MSDHGREGDRGMQRAARRESTATRDGAWAREVGEDDGPRMTD